MAACLWKYFLMGRLTNIAHDICKDVKAPVRIEHLLALGDKYCERMTTLKKKTLDNLFSRLRNNTR